MLLLAKSEEYYKKSSIEQNQGNYPQQAAGYLPKERINFSAI